MGAAGSCEYGTFCRKETLVNDARALHLESLAVLENRGTDAAGMATSSDEMIAVSKYEPMGLNNTSFNLLKLDSKSYHGHRVGIAHPRWATLGGKTDHNAKPHMDYGNQIALVHSGTIRNVHELKSELNRTIIAIKCETEMEMVAHLVALGLHAVPNISLKDASENASFRLGDTWGLAEIVNENTEELVVGCYGSPMVVGIRCEINGITVVGV